MTKDKIANVSSGNGAFNTIKYFFKAGQIQKLS